MHEEMVGAEMIEIILMIDGDGDGAGGDDNGGDADNDGGDWW